MFHCSNPWHQDLRNLHYFHSILARNIGSCAVKVWLMGGWYSSEMIISRWVDIRCSSAMIIYYLLWVKISFYMNMTLSCFDTKLGLKIWHKNRINWKYLNGCRIIYGCRKYREKNWGIQTSFSLTHSKLLPSWTIFKEDTKSLLDLSYISF